jgi:predicted nucleic-acid-binding protein
VDIDPGSYRATRADVVVEKLLQEPNGRFEDDEVISSALQAYRQTATDFADAPVVHKAVNTAAIDDELTAVYTLDTNALQLPNTAEP